MSIKKVVLFPNLKKKGVKKAISFLKKRLKEKKIKIEKEISSQSDLVIAIGGDGTILKAAREIKNGKTLLLGVNLGEVGFLTTTTLERLNESLNEILTNNFFISPRLMLKVQVRRNATSRQNCFCLNEVVLMRRDPRVLSLKILGRKGKIGEFCVDGLIIATPTGSTGHSLSAGGPLVFPEEEIIILTPICSVSLASRPLILSANEELRIEIDSPDANLTIDGQKNFLLKRKDLLLVRRSPFSLKLIDTSRKGYFRLLQEKLGWLP
ncbi:MAG: NAD(+)/NADH kinase [Candidatus Omnitrophica bacterium]|nr:NAD(+)/NADH kinase [Candidatus Omnitrophota bacterium]